MQTNSHSAANRFHNLPLTLTAGAMLLLLAACPVLAQTFVEQTGTGLAGSWNGGAAWGDYDNDGDLDVALTGRGGNGTPVCQVCRNDGSGFVVQNGIVITGVRNGGLAWGDCDNDGDLDLLVTGQGVGGPVTKLYRNNGNGGFGEVANAGLLAVQYSRAAWGDYDNDGDLDVVLCGQTAALQQMTKLYRNNGDGSFSEQVGSAPIGVRECAVAWGDYDNDGDLDLLLAGFTGNVMVAKVYRNNGDSSFSDATGDSLTGVCVPGLAWGDYDNDGDLDIVLTGGSDVVTGGNPIGRLYRNEGGIFQEQAGVVLPAIFHASAAWGDHDQDGDVDLLLTGCDAARVPQTRLYRNNGDNTFVPQDSLALAAVSHGMGVWGDVDGDGDLDILVSGYTGSGGLTKLYRNQTGMANTSPAAPTGLTAAAVAEGIRLSWAAASDGATPAAGLTYNLRIGTAPGKDDLLGCMADPTGGLRRLASGGLVQGTNWVWCARAAAGGTYYWSVQAVDGGLAGSPFAAEGTARVLGAPRDVQASDGTYTDRVTVAWTTVAADLYEVWRGTGTDLATATHLSVGNDPTGTSYTDTTAQPGVTYSYWVRGRFGGVAGGFSAADTGWLRTSTFEEQSGTGLPPMANGPVAWGDYDNDGDLDVVLTGLDGSGAHVTQLYRNNGGLRFSVVSQAGLIGVRIGGLAWGDYDNDGDLDLLVTGELLGGAAIAKLYRNEGGGVFAEVASAGFTGVKYSSVAWGDYDNDGHLDLVLTGYTGMQQVSKVYRNNGSGVFVEPPGIALVAVRESAVAWGDCDNDGDLDILLAGFTGSAMTSKVYRNNGNGTFSDWTGASLTGVCAPAVAWGDYDNDGDLDILLSGGSDAVTGGNPIAKVYRNEGLGLFREQAGIPLPGLYHSSAAWGDYDNDGDLDILLSGANAARRAEPIGLYRNNGDNTFAPQLGQALAGVFSCGGVAWGDADGDGDLDLLVTGFDRKSALLTKLYRNEAVRANVPPTAPTGLAVLSVSEGLRLSWVAGSDNATPAAGLMYSLRIGTAPGKDDLLGCMADPTNGLRRTAAQGLVQGTNWVWRARDVAKGLYYWSVQAVDGGLAGSAFAAESTTRVLGAPLDVQASDGTYTDRVVVAWTTVDADLYEVWRGAGAELAAATHLSAGQDPTGTNYTDTTAQPGVTYSYWVRGRFGGVAGGFGAPDAGWLRTPAFAEQPGTGLAALWDTATAWGDYDNDGDLDLVLTGRDRAGTPLSKVYRNDGAGVFVEQAQIPLTGVCQGSVAWGDYDRDGRLDLLLTGENRQRNPVTEFYWNKGDNTFKRQMGAGLTAVKYGSVAWGDADNDGDLDILLTGYNGRSAVAKIYRNHGNGFFSPGNERDLVGVSESAAAWGDYDNDGDLDILLTGRAGLQTVSRVYRNEGNLSFKEDHRANLPGVREGAVAWGDYDNDGDLDILLCGDPDAFCFGAPLTRVYRNDGPAGFSRQGGIALTGFDRGSAAWGDYDNDGDLDILVGGYTRQHVSATCVYRNNGDNTFTDRSGYGLAGVAGGGAAWGDYDNDGDLDILATGAGEGVAVARLYRNGALAPNQAPTAPGALAVTTLPLGVRLAWQAAADAETPASGLTYSLRIGTAAGSGNRLSGMADAGSGYRRIVWQGLVQGTSWVWRVNLAGYETYYWSVQAVDSTLRGSAYAAEGRFNSRGALEPDRGVAGEGVLAVAGDAQPRIANMAVSAGRLLIGWQGSPASCYDIEWSDSLLPGARWTPLATGVPSTAAVNIVVDPSPLTTQRFYRMRLTR